MWAFFTCKLDSTQNVTPTFNFPGLESSIQVKKLGNDIIKGITATANGFYGPQGRSLRLSARVPEMNEYLNRFEYQGQKILNFEMETSALYGLTALLGHQSCTVCAVIANRFSGKYSKDYKKAVEDLIQIILQRIWRFFLATF